jgi:hypothetical protein
VRKGGGGDSLDQIMCQQFHVSWISSIHIYIYIYICVYIYIYIILLSFSQIHLQFLY